MRKVIDRQNENYEKYFFIIRIIFSIGFSGNAQHVNARISFPAGIHVRPSVQSPYRGAIWVGPEWQFRSNRYYAVPGYWARPHRHHGVWVQGYWKYSRHGYWWVPGHWRNISIKNFS